MFFIRIALQICLCMNAFRSGAKCTNPLSHPIQSFSIFFSSSLAASVSIPFSRISTHLIVDCLPTKYYQLTTRISVIELKNASNSFRPDWIDNIQLDAEHFSLKCISIFHHGISSHSRYINLKFHSHNHTNIWKYITLGILFVATRKSKKKKKIKIGRTLPWESAKN